jgi:integrase
MHRSTLDYRDRAMLLLGFGAALSRAQLVALNVADLRFTPDAMIVRVRRNGETRRTGDGVATTGEGRQVSVPVTGGELCAASAVRAWIAHAALDANPAAPNVPLFCRFDRAGDPTPDRLDSAYVSMVLKRRLREVGIDPTRYSAHSLKRGRLVELARGTL